MTINALRTGTPHSFRADMVRREATSRASLAFFLKAYAGGLAFFVAMLL